MSLRSSSQQPPGRQYMSNAIGSSRESNPSRRICHLRVIPFGRVADKRLVYICECVMLAFLIVLVHLFARKKIG